MRITGVIRVVEQPTRADIGVDGQLGSQRVRSLPSMGKQAQPRLDRAEFGVDRGYPDLSGFGAVLLVRYMV